MDEFRSAFPGIDCPLKGYGMVPRHVRSHDEDDVGIQQILRRGGGPSATE